MKLQYVMLWYILFWEFVGQSDLHLWNGFDLCKGEVELREEVLQRVKIYHFHELLTSAMPYPETTTQVSNLFFVKPCLEKVPFILRVGGHLFIFSFG